MGYPFLDIEISVVEYSIIKLDNRNIWLTDVTLSEVLHAIQHSFLWATNMYIFNIPVLGPEV